ncbi:MAG: NAD(+)/NADH kinase [Chloroflexi bacterium]|nr:NAD(+)/NADH kinase [Chloroflexota bacterium]
MIFNNKRIGIIYNEKLAAARSVAERLARSLKQKEGLLWVCATGQDEQARREMPATGLLITVGGDGTILRAAYLAAPAGVPLLGVNMGKLGFMTELSAEEALKSLPHILSREGRIEERTLLEIRVAPGSDAPREGQTPSQPMLALNDVVIGRTALSRVIYVDAHVDGVHLATYKGDGLIVATATGSTGYALAAGGPILYPQSRDMVIKPICPHLTLENAVVVPSAAQVRLTLPADQRAALSLDGQLEYPLQGSDVVEVVVSRTVARFLRWQPATAFYSTLTARLGLRSANSRLPVVEHKE